MDEKGRREYMKKSFFGGITIGLIAGYGIAKLHCSKGKRLIQRGSDCNRLNGYYETLAQWMSNIQKGIHIEDYFKEKGVKTIAIYGMGELGILLYNELKKSIDIQVLYGIDQSGVCAIDDFDVYYPEEDLPSVDMVVVTPISYKDEIVSKLKEKLNCRYVSIRDVVYWN